MRYRKIPLVTTIILALNVICFAIEFFSGSTRFFYSYGMYQGALRNGEWYRLITNAFLHFDMKTCENSFFMLPVSVAADIIYKDKLAIYSSASSRFASKRRCLHKSEQHPADQNECFRKET